MMTKKAVFMDRDGTINKEINYLSKKEQVEILLNVPEAIKILNESDFMVIIITNQSGVARNYFSEKTLKEINDHLVRELERENAQIDDIFVCTHHPDDECQCRKPRIGLLKEAEENYGIDLTSSYMVGDKFTDLKAGYDAGCKTVLVLTGYGREEIERKGTWDFEPHYIADDLLDAAKWIAGEDTG